MSISHDMSVHGTPLQRCSKPGRPVTGYTRDGMCTMHRGDMGSHHVCLRDVHKNDGVFCKVTGQEDWCKHQRDWCVCEWAFERAVERKGCDTFRIDCDATNMRALDHYKKSGMTNAADCIRQQCGLKK